MGPCDIDREAVRLPGTVDREDTLMDWPLFFAGTVLMVGAVASDPWGRSNWSGAAYLFGASLWIWAVVTA